MNAPDSDLLKRLIMWVTIHPGVVLNSQFQERCLFCGWTGGGRHGHKEDCLWVECHGIRNAEFKANKIK